jgi:hypothetical protein
LWHWLFFSSKEAMEIPVRCCQEIERCNGKEVIWIDELQIVDGLHWLWVLCWTQVEDLSVREVYEKLLTAVQP